MPTYRLDTDRGTFDVETDGPADEPTLARLLDEQLAGGGQEQAAPEGPGFLKQAGALGLRVGGPIIGGALGAVGGPAGIVAGGAAGGAAGEAAAEKLLGEDLRPLGIAAGAVTGAIPAGPFAKLGARAASFGAKLAFGAAEGATQGALGTAIQTGLEEGRLPTQGEAVKSALGGAAFGTVVSGALGRYVEGAPGGTAVAEAAGKAKTAARPTADDLSDVTDDITKAVAQSAPKEKVPGSPFTKSGPEPETPTNPLRPRRVAEHDAIVDRDLANQPEAARDLVKKIYDNNPDLVEEKTRGEAPFARTEEEAARLQFKPDDIAPGYNPNDAEGLAMRNLAARLAAKSTELNAAAAANPSDATMAADLVRAHEDLVDAVLVSRAGGTEQARALNARKIKTTLADQGADLDPASRAIRFVEAANQYGVKRDDIVAAYRRAGDDPTRQMRELINIARPDWPTFFRSLTVTNYLTGTKTGERNLFGNTLRIAEELVTKPAAAAADVVESAATGRARQVRFGEAPVAAIAGLKSVPAGARAGFQILRQGFTADDAARLAFDEGKFDIPHEFKGGGFNPLNYPGRVLNATDIFFKTVATSMVRDAGAYSRAVTKAAAEGLKGPALRDRIAHLAAEIATNPPKELLQEIEEASSRSVFREDNKLARDIDAFINRRSVPAQLFTRLVALPFIRTPANIMKQGFQWTPAGFVSKAGRQAGRLGTTERAKAALGTLLLYPVAQMADEGIIIGSAPTNDAGKRDAFMAEYGLENSIKLGDTRYQLSDLGHLAIPLIAVANTVQTWKSLGKEPSDSDVLELTAKVGKSMLATGASLFDASYLSSVGEILDVVQNPEQNLDKFVQRRITSFIPGQALLRGAAQVEDATVRQPKSISEAVKATLPGYQKDVLPKIDAFGEVVKRGNEGLRALHIPTSKTVEADPMRTELNRLGVEVEPAKPISSVSLTPKHKVAVDRAGDFALRQAKGLTARFYVQRAMESPVYAAADDEKREEIVRRQIKRAGTFVKERAVFVLRRGASLTTDALVPKEMTQQ